jgi:signal peptidase I
MNHEKSYRRLREIWYEWRALVLFLIIMLVFRSAIADWNQVPTGSMKPTILEGDRVIVNKLAYNLKLPFTTWHLAEWSLPLRGDIVTFYSPLDEKLLIKRVIGLPGDVVALRNNQLYINDEPARYRQLDPASVSYLDINQKSGHDFFVEEIDQVVHPVMLIPSQPNKYNSFGPVEVPEDHYLMLGDNRDHSGDSRVIGFVSQDRITGRAHTVAFSVDYDDYYLPRVHRFAKSLAW